MRLLEAFVAIGAISRLPSAVGTREGRRAAGIDYSPEQVGGQIDHYTKLRSSPGWDRPIFTRRRRIADLLRIGDYTNHIQG